MPLIVMTCGLVTGILLSYNLTDQPFIILTSYLVLYALWGTTFASIHLFDASALFINRLIQLGWVCLYAGIGSLLFFLASEQKTPLSALQNKSISGTVFRKHLSESGFQTLHVSLDACYSEHEKENIHGNIIVTLDTSDYVFQLGDRILLKTELQSFEKAVNPGSFDAAFYYSSHHYIGRTFTASPFVAKIGETSSIPIYFAKWQEKLSSVLHDLLPADLSGVAIALLVGAKSDIDQSIIAAFTNTGAMHVLAVSGLHVGVILIAVQKLLSLFSKWISKKQAIIFSFIFIWGFGLLSGASPAVIRAVIMFSIIALGQLLERRGSGINSLLLSAILLLCYDPYYLFDVGFQLSYAAMLGIFLFQAEITRLFWFSNLSLDWLWRGTATGIAATITTTPFVLFWFHQFPNYFLLSNIVVMLLGSVVLYLLITLIFTGWIPYFKHIVIFLSVWSIICLIKGIQLIDSIPGAVSGGFQLDLATFILLTMGIGLISYQLIILKKIHWISLTGFGIIIVFLSFIRIGYLSSNKLEIYVSNQLCGSIQFEGNYIQFYEKAQNNSKAQQLLDCTVRESGLPLTHRLELNNQNTLHIGKMLVKINRTKEGWNFQVGKQFFTYRTNGIPKASENRSLMTKRIQQALGRNEYQFFQLILE